MSELEERLNSILNNPEELGKLGKMAQSLMDSGALGGLLGGGEREDETRENRQEELPDADMLASVGKILSRVSSSEKNDKTALLEAMKPYLTEKRRSKMERALKIAKMARLAEIAFSEYGGK